MPETKIEYPLIVAKRPGRRPAPVVLDVQTSDTLEAIVAGGDWRPKQQRRATAILRIARGARFVQLVQEIGVTRNTLRRWSRLFEKGGVDALMQVGSQSDSPGSQ